MGDVPAPLDVLFLCTGNSARSILGEALMNALGAGRVRACSAGSHPNGAVNPLVIELLHENGLPTAGLRSKRWDEFVAPGAPELDVVITVCDAAAGEACPLWPGRPLAAHWGMPDPAAVIGDIETRRRAFLNAYAALQRRIELFVGLPLATLDRVSLKQRLDRIGRE